MKHLLFSILFLCTTFSFAQQTAHEPKVLVIEQKGDSIFYSGKEFSMEALNFEFDSCDFYRNRFKNTFEIENKTNQTIICPSAFITWYDTHYLRENSHELLILKPGQKGVITIESAVYSKRRMTSPGILKITTADGKTMEIQLTLKYICGKVMCR